MKLLQRIALLPFLLTCFVPAVPAAEDASQNATTSTSQTQVSPATDLTLKRFPLVLGKNLTSNLFSRGNLLPFLIGSGAALAIAPVDQEISRSMYGHAGEFGDEGETWGPIVTASVTGGAFVASRLSKDEHLRAFGYTMGQAFLTNGILTEGLKFATHRMRPNGSSSDSFPSGHTSGAFAAATVVTHYYGKKWGIPLYAFAGLVGVSRIEHGSHWPSDVIAGAALGYISGKAAILGTKRERSRQNNARLIIVPMFGRDWRGFSASLSY